jgi:hypothetical protein
MVMGMSKKISFSDASTTDAEVQISHDTKGFYFIRIEDANGCKEVKMTPEEFAKAVTGTLAKAKTN